jgi:Spy/CpxP family protein refolding chaperone
MAFTCPAPALFAAPEKEQAPKVDRVQQLAEQLTLTAKQQAQVKGFYDEAEKIIKELPRDDKFQSKRRSAFRNANKKIRKILTPEQQKKFDEITAQKSGASAQQSK